MARGRASSPTVVTQTICGSRSKYREKNVQTCCVLEQADVKKTEYDYKRNDWVAELKVMMGRAKSRGAMPNSNKYFRSAVVPIVVPDTQSMVTPPQCSHRILKDMARSAQSQTCPVKPEPCRTIGTQTDYRDSEAQTTPWEPPYKIRPGHNPEVLAIAHLTWNQGLPAGVNEVEIINRMRMRRAWEAILPPMDTPCNIKMRTSIVTALEVDEWAYRESEIQAIMDYRLELMEEITRSRRNQREKKTKARFARLRDRLDKWRDNEITSIRHSLKRDLRKLKRKHQRKPLKRDVIEEHADPGSELYAPLLRHGAHPGRRHEAIRKELLREDYIECTEDVDTMPDWLPTYEELKAIKPKPKPSELCVRETRWTEEKLEQLHSYLKAIRLNLKPVEALSLMKRKYKQPPLPLTPRRPNEEDPEWVRIDQYSTLIQKLIRGRAVQCMMFEGRERCRELIEELQSTSALDWESQRERDKEKMRMIELQRLQNERSIQEDRLCEVLNSLEGATVAEMLDFLSQELIRLEDERRIHAFALLAERERWMREAEEAGRRQVERNRRREFDEMFRQLVKVNQDSVDAYLEDIISEGIEWVSDEAAREYISELMEKADAVAKYAAENATELEQEEMIADMIYNFVLPEVEKENLRRNIRENQQSYLRNAHAAIYEEILDLPRVEGLSLSDKGDRAFLAEIGEAHDWENIDGSPEDESAVGGVESVGTWTESAASDITIESEQVIRDLLESIIQEVTGYWDLFDTAE